MLAISLSVAFIIAILSGLGVGGGGLFVVYLSLFTNTPQLQIQGTNLAFFLCCASASLIIHLRKRKIFALSVITMSLFGIIGAALGTSLSLSVNQMLLRKIFGAMLLASGIISLKGSKKRNL